MLKISSTPIGVSLTGLLFYLFGLNEMFITYCKTRGDIFIPWYIICHYILENLVLTSLMLLIDYNFRDFLIYRLNDSLPFNLKLFTLFDTYEDCQLS